VALLTEICLGYRAGGIDIMVGGSSEDYGEGTLSSEEWRFF